MIRQPFALGLLVIIRFSPNRPGGGGGGEGLFFQDYQFHSCHSEPSSLMMSKLCDFQFLYLKPRLHPQFSTRTGISCSATEVEGGCTCSQVFPISATCCKKFITINILQHYPSDLVA